jgi:hypothetical protein
MECRRFSKVLVDIFPHDLKKVVGDFVYGIGIFSCNQIFDGGVEELCYFIGLNGIWENGFENPVLEGA